MSKEIVVGIELVKILGKIRGIDENIEMIMDENTFYEWKDKIRKDGDIQDIIKDFENLRAYLLKKTKGHFIDLDRKNWDNMVDPMDYVLDKLKEFKK